MVTILSRSRVIQDRPFCFRCVNIGVCATIVHVRFWSQIPFVGKPCSLWRHAAHPANTRFVLVRISPQAVWIANNLCTSLLMFWATTVAQHEVPVLGIETTRVSLKANTWFWCCPHRNCAGHSSNLSSHQINIKQTSHALLWLPTLWCKTRYTVGPTPLCDQPALHENASAFYSDV